jgi:hypothetical protein
LLYFILLIGYTIWLWLYYQFYIKKLNVRFRYQIRSVVQFDAIVHTWLKSDFQHLLSSISCLFCYYFQINNVLVLIMCTFGFLDSSYSLILNQISSTFVMKIYVTINWCPVRFIPWSLFYLEVRSFIFFSVITVGFGSLNALLI